MTRNNVGLIVFISLHLVIHVNTARILSVFPVPCKSHQFFFRSFTQELLKRGHELVVITTEPAFTKDQAHQNLTEIDVKNVSQQYWDKKFLTTSRGNKYDIITPIMVALDALVDIFENQLRSPEVEELLKDKNKKFDLIIVESITQLPLAYTHVFKVPLIQITSMFPIGGNYESLGTSSHPILYSSILKQKIELTIWDKLFDLYNYFSLEYAMRELDQKKKIMIERYFGNNIPSYKKLKNNVHMLFLNAHPIIDLNRPIPLSIKYVNGIHEVPPKNLPQDMKQYLDASKNGVIYVSFGSSTNPSKLNPNFIKIMIKVLSDLPYNVLLKWDLEEIPQKSKNIKILRWLPQVALLKHPNVKLFITQGGMQSTDEAITAGVPLIGIPLATDQWLNTEIYVKYKFGLKLDIEVITEEVLRNAVTSVLEDESYRQNMIKYRSLVLDQPHFPKERAMLWIEHVLRHSGAKHLRAPAANVTWSEYYELDLISIITTMFMFVTVSVVYLFKTLIKLLIKGKIKSN